MALFFSVKMASASFQTKQSFLFHTGTTRWRSHQAEGEGSMINILASRMTTHLLLSSLRRIVNACPDRRIDCSSPFMEEFFKMRQTENEMPIADNLRPLPYGVWRLNPFCFSFIPSLKQ
jgi:hypothetical protein